MARQTRLNLTVRYRVSTAFNWYAVPLSHWLFNDWAETILALYAQRSTQGDTTAIH